MSRIYSQSLLRRWPQNFRSTSTSHQHPRKISAKGKTGRAFQNSTVKAKAENNEEKGKMGKEKEEGRGEKNRGRERERKRDPETISMSNKSQSV